MVLCFQLRGTPACMPHSARNGRPSMERERALGSASLGTICVMQTNIHINCILTAFHFDAGLANIGNWIQICCLIGRPPEIYQRNQFRRTNPLGNAMWRHHSYRVTLSKYLPAICLNNMSISLILSHSPASLYFTSYQQNKLIQIYVWYIFCQLISQVSIMICCIG